MERILLLTDFSSCSEKAQEVAATVAAKHNAEVHLLHVVETVVQWDDMKFMTTKSAVLPTDEQHDLFPEVKATVGKADHLMNEAIRSMEVEGLKTKKHLLFNKSYNDIIEFIDDWNIDLVVMGTHGQPDLKTEVIGSNTLNVARKAPCPVICVKDESEDRNINSVVFAADFREKELVANLAKVKDFTEPFDATIHLLFVNTPINFEDSYSSFALMEKAASDFGLKNYTVNIINHYTPYQGIVEFAEDRDVSMISLSIHGYTGVRRFFNSNITEAVMLMSEIPVMSLNMH